MIKNAVACCTTTVRSSPCGCWKMLSSSERKDARVGPDVAELELVLGGPRVAELVPPFQERMDNSKNCNRMTWMFPRSGMVQQVDSTPTSYLFILQRNVWTLNCLQYHALVNRPRAVRSVRSFANGPFRDVQEFSIYTIGSRSRSMAYSSYKLGSISIPPYASLHSIPPMSLFIPFPHISLHSFPIRLSLSFNTSIYRDRHHSIFVF